MQMFTLVYGQNCSYCCVILPLILHTANVPYPDVLTWYIRVTLQLLQHAAGLM